VKKVLVIGIVFFVAGLWPTKAQREVMGRTYFEPVKTAEATPQSALPTRVTITSINLDSPIQQMGLDKLGRMDVPNNHKNIGWYKNGTVPGEKGSAVLAAHVYAAFRNLNKVQIGDEVLITDNNGNKLKFIIKKKSLFDLSKMSPDQLFNDSSGKLLKLITCAGKKTGDERGYDKRLVLTAELQD
jgi:sortase A